MIQRLEQLLTRAREGAEKTIAVAAAQDEEVLLAAAKAKKAGLASFILVGDEPAIREIAARCNVDLGEFELRHEPDPAIACAKAVALVSAGQAHMVMKGIVDTGVILKALLDKDYGRRAGGIISHVGVFEVPGFDRLLYVADAAMNITPDLQTKRQIIENTLQVTRALGNDMPVAAVLCAKEKVSPKMPATMDAQALREMNLNGEIKGCHVIGPVALDNAISEAAAKHKKIADPNAGKADILIVPQIETGNVLYKALIFLAHAKSAGVIVGAKEPVIVTSRADTDETKLYSIALAVMMTNLA